MRVLLPPCTLGSAHHFFHRISKGSSIVESRPSTPTRKSASSAIRVLSLNASFAGNSGFVAYLLNTRSAALSCFALSLAASIIGNVPDAAVPQMTIATSKVLPLLSVGKMTLRLYAALNYSQNSAHDLRRALNGA